MESLTAVGAPLYGKQTWQTLEFSSRL